MNIKKTTTHHIINMKKTNIQTIAIIIFIVILMALGSYLIYYKNMEKVAFKSYMNAAYGISFLYPDYYDLKESSLPENEPGTLVTLTNKGATLPKDGKSPTAITVAMYDSANTTTPKNNSAYLLKNPMDAWIKSSPYSNFTLSAQQAPGITAIAGKDARLYTWNGLYQGTTMVTFVNNHIFMLSVTYQGNTDMKKRQDFTRLIESLHFEETK